MPANTPRPAPASAAIASGPFNAASVRSNATTLRYGDVGCTRPVLLTSTTACDPLNHVFVRAADGCPSPQLAYRRGKKLEQTTTYGRNAMGVCTPQQIFLSPTDGIFELEEIPLTTFVGAAVKPGMGDRIVPELLEAEDGSQAVLGWRDSMRAHSCLPRPAADGMFRCLPTEGGTSIASLFSDDACTTPVALGETSGCTSIPYALRTEVMR